YFTAAAMMLKVAVRLVPTRRTAVMITTEMSAAIRPYSIAVAPLSSRRNVEIFDIDNSLDLTRWSKVVDPCTARFVREKSEERVLRQPLLFAGLVIFCTAPACRERQQKTRAKWQELASKIGCASAI